MCLLENLRQTDNKYENSKILPNYFSHYFIIICNHSINKDDRKGGEEEWRGWSF